MSAAKRMQNVRLGRIESGLKHIDSGTLSIRRHLRGLAKFGAGENVGSTETCNEAQLILEASELAVADAQAAVGIYLALLADLTTYRDAAALAVQQECFV